MGASIGVISNISSFCLFMLFHIICSLFYYGSYQIMFDLLDLIFLIYAKILEMHMFLFIYFLYAFISTILEKVLLRSKIFGIS